MDLMNLWIARPNVGTISWIDKKIYLPKMLKEPNAHIRKDKILFRVSLEKKPNWLACEGTKGIY